MERKITVGAFVGQGTLGKESEFREKHPSVSALFDALKVRKPTTELPQLSTYRASTLLAAQLNIDFDVVIGHSVGEYSALTAAGVIPSSDIGSLIISLRQDIMDRVNVGRRPAAKVTPLTGTGQVSGDFITRVEDFTQGHDGISIGLYNSPEWLVIVGSDEALNDALNTGDLPFIARRLPLRGPFHSESHYREIAEADFRQTLAREISKWNPITGQTPAIYSNVTARRYRSQDELLENLVKQVYTPVHFFQGVRRIYESARDIGHRVEFFEIGPGDRFLSSLIDQTLRGEDGYSVIPINTEQQAIAYRDDPAGYVAALG